MTEDDDARTARIRKAASESTQQFLDGHLTPEEARHALNVGRMCLEFACLEEAIGELKVTTEQARSGSKAYMALVRTGRGVLTAIRDLAAADAQWSNLGADYRRFKNERDRYAHASVGTVIEEREGSDGGRPVIHILTGLQKHPRGDQHPLGQVSGLPTDRETSDLIREMRRLRMQLLMAKTNITIQRAVRVPLPDIEAMTRRVVRSALGGLGNILGRGDR